jgi:hypothetical protein
VDTFLTLIIALGGIATGIGAIWAALAARRQAQLTDQSLIEQRQFLQEQTDIAKRQAQVSERNLDLSERSLSEQIQSLREQTDQTRLNLELDLLFRYADRFDSPLLLRRRRAAASYLLENAFVEDEMVKIEQLNRAGWEVCSFFEDVGYSQRVGALQPATVHTRFGYAARAYWPLCKPAIEKLRRRQDPPDTARYEQFEYLSRVLADLEREWGVEPPTKEWLREVMETEAIAGEEPPTVSQ